MKYINHFSCLNEVEFVFGFLQFSIILRYFDSTLAGPCIGETYIRFLNTFCVRSKNLSEYISKNGDESSKMKLRRLGFIMKKS